MTEASLLSLIAPRWRAAREKGSAPAAIGVHSETRWQGPAEITLDSVRVPVAQCDSVLAAREQLASRGPNWFVLVTPLELTDLGADVEARLLRHRLLRVEPWDLLRSRFNARTFDGSLLGKAALADAAVEALGATNPDPAPAGVLTAESVWRVVIGNRLGVDEARPDARKWLEWAQDATACARWRALGDELKGLLVDWMAGSLGDWAIALAGCLDSGYGQQAMALGIALGVLRQERQDAQERVVLAQASGRLEQYAGGRTISAQAQRVWNEAAEQWAAARAAAGDIATVLNEIGEADRILEKIGALPLAWLGKWSVAGFAQRLERFSGAGLQAGSPDFEARLREVESHELARWSARERSWTERARMAARLARWLATSPNPAKDWAESVSCYVEHGAWVDWARQTLTAGDEPEGTARSWAALCERTARRRDEENLVFGRQLADAVQRDSFGDTVIPVERVLERVVAPWAKDRVLLILMDGMSMAVWRELSQELVQAGAQLWSWREGQPLPPGLSALPSMTRFSRASLLCGKLASGGQEVERRGFAENPSLMGASRSGYPPVLFHKDELAGETTRKEIRNPQRRVVGVVINVVDDSLDGPDQRTFHWSLSQVPVLRALLAEAETAGRAVIFASDHGHVMDRGAVMRRSGSADRYRFPEEGAPGEDEVLLAGRRVLEEGGGVVALATEVGRYTPSRKLGYHGGATPQECLAPLAAISPAAKGPEGWAKTVENVPPWWYAGGVLPAEPTAKPKARRAEPLFEGVAGIERDWVRELLNGPAFAEQMRIAGGRLDGARAEQALRALAARNGVLMKPALAQRLDLPQFRIDGFLSSFERVLNVDGYPVVSVDDSETVRLDIDLLKKQFGLE